MFVEEPMGFSKCHRIIDTRLINFTHQTAMQLSDHELKRHPSFRFPASMPITVEQRHITKIKNGSYMFTAKADGVRVLIVFFMYYLDGDWQRLCCCLQRDGSCHVLTQETPSELNEGGGSLFDGELVGTPNGWSTILLFDCYAYSGQNMRNLPLLRRYSRCERLAEAYVEREIDSVRFSAKPFYPLNSDGLHDAEAFLTNTNHYLPYATDGIILVPSGRCETSFGRDENQFKLKSDHTVDLIVIQDVDDEEQPFFLASYDETDDTYVTKQQIANLDVNAVYECRVVIAEDITTFEPIKQRPDKQHPNSESVLKRTLRTIADDVSIKELIGA